NLEKQLKEPEALDKYKQAVAADANNIAALVKCAELNASIGARQTDKNWKIIYYNNTQTFARQAYAADSNSADASYAMALAAAKMTEIADENKQVIAYVRETKMYIDKALTVNTSHAKANYTLGKWHYEMVTLSWVKKAAVKAIYGGLPKGAIDSAILYMEKCRKLDQYFVRNYLDLAKAYQYDSKPTKEMEILNLLIKLPLRTADDAALKAEGKKMLDQMM
ncbi:MAG TPA: hypothetical protein PLA68_07075, partial [Panacibacter sp.]|nr:hypothetical protein [Panacibacter sp.]